MVGGTGESMCADEPLPLPSIPPAARATATFTVKAAGVVAGLAVADAVFAAVDGGIKAEWRVRDGDAVAPGAVLGTASGPAPALLVAERVALNFMQRMGGIATAAAALAAAAAPAAALDTRKTAPGLRVPDKWAVVIGGGTPHRMGLFDMVMVKDNHVAAAGGLRAAAQRARAFLLSRGLASVPIELEARTLDEVDEALAIIKEGGSGVTRLMLDNMTSTDPATGAVDASALAAAMALVRQSGVDVETEASGGITAASAAAAAAAGVTHVSCGALTHSSPALDISMLVELVPEGTEAA